MTTDKYQGRQCPLEARARSVEKDVRDIKGMLCGIYDRFGDLVDTAEATYRSVTYHESGAGTKDENWDFLDDEE